MSNEVAKQIATNELTARGFQVEPIDRREGKTADLLVTGQNSNYLIEAKDRLVDEYKRHGLAAVGATAVLEALQQGRADTLIVTRDAQLKGTSCRDCQHVAHGTPQNCQKCGAKSVFELDLIDEFNRQAELTGARVEFSDAIPGLTKAGHVAALLRY